MDPSQTESNNCGSYQPSASDASSTHRSSSEHGPSEDYVPSESGSAPQDPQKTRSRSPQKRVSDWHQTSRGERSEEKFRLLDEETAEYAFIPLCPQGTVTNWNKGAGRLTGYDKEEILGTHFSVFHPQTEIDAGETDRALETAARQGVWSGKGWRVRKDGSKFWAHEKIAALGAEGDSQREDGEPLGFAKVIHDVTERLELQREILRVQEEEWRRLKEDIHDVNGSQLTGANLLISRAHQEADDESLAGRLQKIRDLISESCEALQQISRKLTPTGLSRGGLPEALERLAEDTEGGRFEVGPSEAGKNFPELEENEAAQLYWIAREATTSARRQKGAGEIVLRLTEENGALLLLVKDDRERFDPSAPGTSAGDLPLPLRTMRHRADLLGADLKVESCPGDGTRVQCRLPL